MRLPDFARSSVPPDPGWTVRAPCGCTFELLASVWTMCLDHRAWMIIEQGTGQEYAPSGMPPRPAPERRCASCEGWGHDRDTGLVCEVCRGKGG